MDEPLLQKTVLATILPPLAEGLGERERTWMRRALEESILPWHLARVTAMPEAAQIPAAASIANDLLSSLLPLPAVSRFQEIIRLHYEARVGKLSADAFAMARARADQGVVTPALVRQVAAIQARIGTVGRELNKLQLVATATFLPRLADAMLDCRYAMFGRPITTLRLHRYLENRGPELAG